MIYHLPVFISAGFTANTEAERHTTFYSLPSSLERTPTKMTTSQKVTFCSHGNSAFQPISSSCKIVPQSQVPNPESPGKSFQPITMSCKIVSGIQMTCVKWMGVKIIGLTKQNTVALKIFFFSSSKQGFCLFNKWATHLISKAKVSQGKNKNYSYEHIFWMRQEMLFKAVKFSSPRISTGKICAKMYVETKVGINVLGLYLETSD